MNIFGKLSWCETDPLLPFVFWTWVFVKIHAFLHDRRQRSQARGRNTRRIAPPTCIVLAWITSQLMTAAELANMISCWWLPKLCQRLGGSGFESHCWLCCLGIFPGFPSDVQRRNARIGPLMFTHGCIYPLPQLHANKPSREAAWPSYSTFLSHLPLHLTSIPPYQVGRPPIHTRTNFPWWYNGGTLTISEIPTMHENHVGALLWCGVSKQCIWKCQYCICNVKVSEKYTYQTFSHANMKALLRKSQKWYRENGIIPLK